MGILRHHGIQPSAQRVAVAGYILYTHDHPSADQVWATVRARFPLLSRATVYNTLHRFAEKGLIRELVLTPGRIVFDANVGPHHHFIDENTGRIYDIPWPALKVGNVRRLRRFKVRDYHVVLRGTRAGRRASQ
ncbi:MAG: Fur family transcriptional regulator [Candidatus Binatia bacterium]